MNHDRACPRALCSRRAGNLITVPLQLRRTSHWERQLREVAPLIIRPMQTANPPVENASSLDPWIGAADRALRALFAPAHASRPIPQPATPAAPAAAATPELSPDERRRAAALMRVNHAGEIAAQALYH